MTVAVINHAIRLVTISCHNCGVVYAMPDYMQTARMADHQTFYCPSGHGAAYQGETEAQKLRKQLDSEIKKREWAQQAEQKAEAQAGKLATELSRLKKRVAKGVCPCCKRTVGRLARHMETKHPEFAAPVAKGTP